jgi:hypothetical protein
MQESSILKILQKFETFLEMTKDNDKSTFQILEDKVFILNM